MHAESSRRPRRTTGMLLDHETAFGLEPFIGQRRPAAKIRPPIPGSFLDRPQKVRRAPHRPAAAIIIAVVSDKKLLPKERQPKRIAQTPGNQLRLAAFRPDAQHRSAAHDLALYNLAR